MRLVARDKLRPHSGLFFFRRLLQRKAIFDVFFFFSAVNKVSTGGLCVCVCVAPLAVTCQWCFYCCFFCITSLSGMGGAAVALLLSKTLLKAIFYVHSPLHAGTSFLPFTADVTGAISRVHHELSRNKCCDGYGRGSTNLADLHWCAQTKRCNGN